MFVKISTFLPLSSVYNRLISGLNRKSSLGNIISHMGISNMKKILHKVIFPCEARIENESK
jgi:hypothetical protein